jgi:hypothetical protein
MDGALERDTRPSSGKLRAKPPSWHCGHDVPLLQAENIWSLAHAIGPEGGAEVCLVASAYRDHGKGAKQLDPPLTPGALSLMCLQSWPFSVSIPGDAS